MDIRRFLDPLLDALFPPHCVSCGLFGAWCCSACLLRLELVRRDPCAACGSLKDRACSADAKELDALVTIGFYRDPILRALIHRLKYDGATCVLPALAQALLVSRVARSDPWPWAGEHEIALQAVVGSAARIREREFDQAVLLRDLVRQGLVPWAEPLSVLERKKTIHSQAELEHGPIRAANVHDAYRATSAAPKAVILVDDVFTTGATMRAAARALRSAGAERVYGFAWAIG